MHNEDQVYAYAFALVANEDQAFGGEETESSRNVDLYCNKSPKSVSFTRLQSHAKRGNDTKADQTDAIA